MSEEKKLKICWWVAGIAWTATVALTWADERVNVPLWLRLIFVPVLLVTAFGFSTPIVMDYVDEIRHKPTSILGVECHQRSKARPVVGIVCIQLMLFTAVFYSGYQYAMELREAPANVLNSLREAQRNAERYEKLWKQADDDKDILGSELTKAHQHITELEGAQVRLNEQLEAAQKRIAVIADREVLRGKCAQWIQEIRRFQLRLFEEGDLQTDEWEAFKSRFVGFAKESLTGDQLVLLDSSAGIAMPSFWPEPLRSQTDKDKQRWAILYRWETRLAQIIQSTQ